MFQPIKLSIFDLNTLAYQGMIDEVEKLVYRQSFTDIPSSELQLSRDQTELQLDQLLIINNDTYHPQVVVEKQNNLKDSFITYTLMDAKGLLERRVVENHNKTYTNVNISTIMTDVVARHCVPAFIIGGSARGFTNFDAEADPLIGDFMDYQEDWATVADVCKKFADANSNPLGWMVYYSGASLRFGLRPLVDRTINQTTYSPIVYSEDLDNVIDIQYHNATRGTSNLSYTGQSHFPVGFGAATSYGRKEYLVSSQQNTQAGLSADAWGDINKKAVINTISMEVVTDPTGNAYLSLGDIITIKSIVTGSQAISCAVMEIETTYEKGTYTVKGTFSPRTTNFTPTGARSNVFHQIKQSVTHAKNKSVQHSVSHKNPHTRTEHVTVAFSGNAQQVTGHGTFTQPFKSPPNIHVGHMAASCTNSNRMFHPVITNVTTTGFDVSYVCQDSYVLGTGLQVVFYVHGTVSDAPNSYPLG